MTSESRVEEYFDPLETLPRDELEALRREAISGVVALAWAELPFYQEHWRDAPSAARAGDPAEFERIPLTRKRDLVRASRDRRSAFNGTEALLGETARNLVMTSGTMGFNTFATVTDLDLDGAGTRAQCRELWMMGVRPGMRVLSISPAWHALGLFETRALTAIGAVPVLPWGTLTPRFVGDLLEAVMLLRPEHLLVTARALRLLMAECERIGVDSREAFASVRYVGCAGEALSPAFRDHVRERFEAQDVFERGGSGDGMFGGGECFAHRGHHISADVHHVEVIDPDTGSPVPDGRRGSAVVTNLSPGKSLYVRFDTEDVAEIVPGDCPCGRTHPVVEFYARLADSAVLPDRILTPADVRMVLDTIEQARFAPFSMEWDAADGVLHVRLGGDASGLAAIAPEVAEGVTAALGLSVEVTAGDTLSRGWKEERVGRGRRSP